MELALPQAESLHPSPAAEALRQNRALIEQLSKEVRTISHLLHPPLLDEIGLLAAIRLFADGFAERSKVQVTVELSDGAGPSFAQCGNFDFPNRARMLDQYLPALGQQNSPNQDMAT